MALLPTRWPVSICDSSGDPSGLPWMRWLTYTPNMNSRREGAATVTRDQYCDGGVRGITGPSANAGTQFWRLVPTNQSVEGHPVFAVINKTTGQLAAASYNEGGFIGAWFGVGARDRFGVNAQVLGLTFDDVTDANPDLWLARDGLAVNHRLQWAAVIQGQTRRVVTNFFTKLNQCEGSYIGGWQSTGYSPFSSPSPISDPNDEGISGFYVLREDFSVLYNEHRNLFIPNPYFGTVSTIPTCIFQVCNLDPDKPWSAACLAYAAAHPGRLTLAKLLTPRCTTGTNYLDRVLNDPVCSYWCRAGLPTSAEGGDATIHEQCRVVRLASCKRFYDPNSSDGFTAGTPPETIDKCACFMPQEFYTQLLSRAGSTVPQNTSPLCFFQPCSNSNFGLDYWQVDSCPGVAICIQQGGGVLGSSCNTDGEPVPVPPINPPPVVPPPVIPPVINPSSGLSMWAWIGIVLLVIAVIAVILWWVNRKPKQQEDLETLLLLSALSTAST